MHDLEIPPEATFAEAFALWLEQRVIDPTGASAVRYVSQRTETDWQQYGTALKKFFGPLVLKEIHLGNLHEYQRARAVCDPAWSWSHRAGANLIHREIGFLKRVLSAAGCWTPEEQKKHTPVPLKESEVGRAMTPAEQDYFLRVAASREEWRVVYWWTIISLQTTASTNELRALKRGDVFLDQGILQVRNEGAKNKFRMRAIPLQSELIVWALDQLLQRAARLKATAPYHYVFPVHLSQERYDPLRPMTKWGLRKPWEAVRDAAELPWLRMYDLRHTAITRMAEAGMPIQVIMSFAGHISPRMQQHYTMISMQAKRRWAAAAFAGAEMPYMGGPMPLLAPPVAAAPAAGAIPEWQRQAMAAGWMPAQQMISADRSGDQGYRQAVRRAG